MQRLLSIALCLAALSAAEPIPKPAAAPVAAAKPTTGKAAASTGKSFYYGNYDSDESAESGEHFGRRFGGYIPTHYNRLHGTGGFGNYFGGLGGIPYGSLGAGIGAPYGGLLGGPIIHQGLYGGLGGHGTVGYGGLGGSGTLGYGGLGGSGTLGYGGLGGRGTVGYGDLGGRGTLGYGYGGRGTGGYSYGGLGYDDDDDRRLGSYHYGNRGLSNDRYSYTDNNNYYQGYGGKRPFNYGRY